MFLNEKIYLGLYLYIVWKIIYPSVKVYDYQQGLFFVFYYFALVLESTV